eukprot:CAMPEP_0185776112 /NCGR_PEP_ID=MMETSP1174-20130828/84500_1 /TAXON_ID=35687 /ORGANISM="Dictyocha speculum, Strain CCMP1381" /LENGTH=358 /DNA_ID=CAMNT_0028463917 /DNA_START=41 /DNA_END=1117 /DNA_ORIENTATION=+
MKEALEALRREKEWRTGIGKGHPEGGGCAPTWPGKITKCQRAACLRAVLALRSSANAEPESWARHVAEDVTLVLPLTLYRYQGPVNTNVQRHPVSQQGISALIHEARGLAVALGAICQRGVYHDGRSRPLSDGPQCFPCGVRWLHVLADKDMHHNARGFMAPFELRSLNLIELGLRRELTKRGSILANFNEEGKLVRLELNFDTIGFWRQMQEARGIEGPLMYIPTSRLSALRPTTQARAILEARHPHWIVQVNTAWTNLCGYSCQEANRATLSLLQGDGSQRQAWKSFTLDIKKGFNTSMENIIQRKDGSQLRVFIQVLPLVETGDLLAIIEPHSDSAILATEDIISCVSSISKEDV